jgi:glycosyltransferase involved in cell wall biosynthesis
MRVLLVLGYPFPTQLTIWREVAAAGVDLHMVGTLATQGSDSIPQQAAFPGWATSHELRPVRIRRASGPWWCYRDLRELIRELRPDVVHVLGEPWGLWVLQALSASHTPVVSHGCETIWDQGTPPERVVRRIVAAKTLRRLAGFASWSTTGVLYARHWGLSIEAPTLVTTAELRDPSLFRAARSQRDDTRASWGISDEFVIGYVGRVVPEKGLEWLAASLAQLARSDVRLLVFGAGSSASELTAWSWGDHHAELRGPIEFQDVPKVMASLDLLALPSLTRKTWAEQFGRVVVEAMAAGTPVLASRTGALPEVIGDAGFLVDEGDVPGLAATLGRIIDSEPLQTHVRDLGNRRIETIYAPDNAAERLIAFWHRVIEGARR